MICTSRKPAALHVHGDDFAIWIPTYSSIGAGIAAHSPPPVPPNPPTTGTDVVRDGGFEHGTSFGGSPFAFWTTVEGNVSVTGANVISGAKSLLVDDSITISPALVVNASAFSLTGYPQKTDGRRGGIRVTPGQIVTLTGTGYWISPNGSAQAVLEIAVFDALGNYIEALSGPVWVSETSATTKSQTVTILASEAAYILVDVAATGSGAAGPKFIMDDVSAVLAGSSTSATGSVALTQAGVGADRGDTSVTLTPGADATVQQFATALTANRTITLDTTSAWHGARFRVVRSGTGSGALDVGGLVSIPANTKAFADVEYDGSAWKLTATGPLAPTTLVLYQNANLSTTSLTEVSLASYSLPGGTLSANNQMVRITVSGQVTGGSATGTPRVKFGSTYLDSNAALANSSTFTNTYQVVRTGATAQISDGRELGFVGTTLQGAAPRATPAETLSGAVTIDIRGLQGGPGTTTTLKVDSVLVEYLAS